MKKTLTGILIAGFLFLGGCTEENYNKYRNSQKAETPQTHIQKAEESSGIPTSNYEYNKAQYLQLKQIVDNNNLILKKNNKTSDISEYTIKACVYAKSAEESSAYLIANLEYNKAQIELNKAILEQQKVLLEKE